MNALPRSLAAIAGIGLLALLASGCAVPGGGGYDFGGSYLGYYEPSGIGYGGWGGGYDVGPWRGGGGNVHRGPAEGRQVAAQHAFRPAAAGHAMPSIPSRARPAAHAASRPAARPAHQ